MIGRRDRTQCTIFIMRSLGDLVPEDHILKRVDRVMDFSWLREEVRDCYCEANGRPGVDPEAAVRRRRWNVAVQAYLTAAVFGGADSETLQAAFPRVLATLYGLLRAMSDACRSFYSAPLNSTGNFIPTALAA